MKSRWLRQALPFVTSLCLAGGVVALSGFGTGEPGSGTRLNELVFVDFFAALLTVLLVPPRRREPWRDWSRVEKTFSLLGAAIVLLAGGWFLHGLGGWMLALPWMTTLAAGWHDTTIVSQRALARVGWAVASAFFAALVGSIAGADLDTFLSSDPRGTLAWCLLYFSGNVVIEGFLARNGSR